MSLLEKVRSGRFQVGVVAGFVLACLLGWALNAGAAAVDERRAELAMSARPAAATKADLTAEAQLLLIDLMGDRPGVQMTVDAPLVVRAVAFRDRLAAAGADRELFAFDAYGEAIAEVRARSGWAAASPAAVEKEARLAAAGKPLAFRLFPELVAAR